MLIAFVRLGIAALIVGALLQVAAAHSASRTREALFHLFSAVMMVAVLLWIIGWPMPGDR